QVPQRLLQAGERAHQNRPAAVEAAAVADLPDILDVERVGADEPVPQRLERAVDGLGPAFEARFAPADRSVLAFDADEQPARRRVEGLDPADLALRHASSALAACVPLPPKCRPAASSSSSSGCSLTFLIGTTRHTLEAGSTLRQSPINCL